MLDPNAALAVLNEVLKLVIPGGRRFYAVIPWCDVIWREAWRSSVRVDWPADAELAYDC